MESLLIDSQLTVLSHGKWGKSCTTLLGFGYESVMKDLCQTSKVKDWGKFHHVSQCGACKRMGYLCSRRRRYQISTGQENECRGACRDGMQQEDK